MPMHPWFGTISDGFRIGALKHAFTEIASGGTPDTSNPDNWTEEGGTPWVAISDISSTPTVNTTAKQVTTVGIQEKRLTTFASGTLLYSMYASVGHVAQLNRAAAINQAILALTPRPDIDIRYAFWQLVAMRPFVTIGARTGTQDNLNADTVKNFPFLFPELARQTAIANYLDAKTAAIDALIAKKEQLIEELKKYQEAVISDALTSKNGWESRKIKFALRGVHGGVWGEEPNGIDDLVVIRVADFNREKLSVDIGDCPTIRAIALSQRNNRILEKGDLILEKSGGGELTPVGNVVIFEGDYSAVCSNFVTRLPVRKTFDPKFVAYLFRYLYTSGRNLPHVKQTSGIQNLDVSEYLEEKVSFPCQNEQVAIALALDEKLAAITQAQQCARTTVDELKAYRAALISETVTGRLPILA